MPMNKSVTFLFIIITMTLKCLFSFFILLFAGYTSATEYCIHSVGSDVVAPYLEPQQLEKYRYKLYAQTTIGPSLRATLEHSNLMLDDSIGRSYRFANIYSRFASAKTSELGELENGWLYARSNDYYYVFEMVESDFGLWRPGRRFGFDAGLGTFDRLVGMLFEWSRYGNGGFDFKEVKFTKDFPIYSSALKILLFLKDNLVWRNGELVHENFHGATTYVGENPQLKVVYLKDEDGQLWAFSEDGVSKVLEGQVTKHEIKGRIERGIHHLVLGRSFYSIHQGIYEIVKDGKSFRLVPIELPGPVEDFFFSQFIPSLDGKAIFVLQRQGVHDLQSLENIFIDRESHERVQITGSSKHPALYPDLGGVLFTAGPTFKEAKFYLIQACGAAPPASTFLKLKGYRRLVETYVQAFERILEDVDFSLLRAEQDDWLQKLAASCSSNDQACYAEKYKDRYEILRERFLATRPWYITEDGLHVTSPTRCSFARDMIPEDSLVLAAGAYQGFPIGPAQLRIPGEFHLVIREMERPIALLLSAYEPATWYVHVPPGARISAVYLSGYHPQKIQHLPKGTPVLYSDYEQMGCSTHYVDFDKETKVNALAMQLFGRQPSAIIQATKIRIEFPVE